MPYDLRIPGQVSEIQLRAIELVASLVPENGTVVEVGSLFGRSSYAWAKSVDPSVRVVSIDPWEGNQGVQPLEQRVGVRYGLEQFRKYTQDCPNIDPHKGYSPRDFRDWAQPIDLYYEDAVHTDPIFSENLTFWTSHLRPTGIACGDDYRPRFGDIVNGVAALATRMGRELLTVDFFWCLLPSADAVSGVARVRDALLSLNEEYVAAKRAEGARILSGPLTALGSVTAPEPLTFKARAWNEGLDPWPHEVGAGPLEVVVRLIHEGKVPYCASAKRIDLPVSQLAPDVPVGFEVSLDTSRAPAGRHRVSFEVLGPGSVAKTDMAKLSGPPVSVAREPAPEHEAAKLAAQVQTNGATFTIDLVVADRNWILERLAFEIRAGVERLETSGMRARILDEPSGCADLTYFLPYSVQKSVARGLVGAWFTHQEEQAEAAQRFFARAAEADFVVCGARKYVEQLRGVAKLEPNLVYHGVDLERFRPRLRVGVIGRTYHTGRKGEDLLASCLDISDIEFVFLGAGWPVPGQAVTPNQLPDFYRSLDYLLIPSRIEGGPVPLFEALACGCPVIASDVGCVEDFPHVPFRRGDGESLRKVLVGLRDEKFTLRSAVAGYDWERFGDEHARIFAAELQRVDAQPVCAAASDIVNPPLYVVSHGTEAKSKGGPSTRMALLANSYSERGGTATLLRHEKGTVLDVEKESVTHVFNTWPLASCEDAVSAAAQAGTTVVFSPIFLNLATVPVFHGALLDLLERHKPEADVRPELKPLCAITRPWAQGRSPIQGVEGHFQSTINAVSQASAVIYLSEFERQLVEAIGVPERPSRVIRNGIETITFATADPAAFRAHLGFDSYVLVVGRIEPRKNQALTAHALRHLSIPVVFLGHSGDSRYFQIFKKWSARNAVHVERIDDRALLASAYAGASCTVLASWAEGAPLVAIEAGAAGCPLVLSTMSGEAEYFGEFAEYAHPADLDGIAKAVDRAIEQGQDTGFRARLARFVAERYDIRNHAEETFEFYAELRREQFRLARPPAGGDVVDVTHLAHALSNNQHLTGVTSVERELALALGDERPDVRFVLWNSPLRQYVEVSASAVRDGSFAALANAKELKHSGGVSVPHLSYEGTAPALGTRPAVPSSSDVERPPTLRDQMRSDREVGMPARRRLWRVAKRSVPGMLRFAPSPARPTLAYAGAALVSVVEAKPPPSYDQIAARVRAAPTRPARDQVGAAVSAQQLPPPPAASGNLLAIGTRTLELAVGGANRLFVFGQPWISNDRQLEDMLKFARVNRLRLTPLVHDLLYVTDTGSFPAATRDTYRRRLKLLLEGSESALVTSVQVERALGTFCQLEELSVGIRRVPIGAVFGRREAVVPRRPSGAPDGPFVVYVSSFNARKNHDLLIDVWKDLPRHLRTLDSRAPCPRLVLAGSPQRGFEHFADKKTQAELAASGIDVVIGASDAEVRWLQENCIFSVYPSRSEGWGIPPLESLVAGRLCVASDTLPSVQESDCAGLLSLAPNDRDAWLSTIGAFIARPRMREAFNIAAAQFEAPTWAASVGEVGA